MRTKLTDAVCGQRPPKAGRIEIWDTVLPGLCLRIYPSGARTFSLMPRDRFGQGSRASRQRRISLWPRYPLLTLAEARRQGRELMMQWMAGGGLPESKVVHDSTETIIGLWVSIKLKKARTKKAMERRVLRALTPWLKRSIRAIKRSDIQRIIDSVRETKGPQAARSIHADLHNFLKWALRRQYIDSNPAVGSDVPEASTPRQRALTDDELRAIWLASGELDWPWRPFVRLLILTGQRRNEVLNLPRRELNLDRAEWFLPAARAKNKQDHLIPLSPQAMAIIEELPEIYNPSGLLFPSPRGLPTNMNYVNTFKKRLDELSGVSGWVLHDIRRTVATGLQRLGVKLEVTEAVLNHVGGTKAGIVGTYQTYSYATEKRAALEAWARHVDYLVTGEDAKVITLPTKGA